MRELNPAKEEIAMHDGYSKVGIADNGGRRTGDDRRKVSVLGFLPERRAGQDRRIYQDRRSIIDEGNVAFLRRNTDRYMEFANTQKGLLYGLLLSIPLWGLIIFMFLIRSTPKF
jgi:hypothetical protein